MHRSMFSQCLFAGAALLFSPNILTAQQHPALTFSGAVSSAGGELAQRGGGGGSAGFSMRLGRPDRLVGLRPDISLHVFQPDRERGPGPSTRRVNTPYFPSVGLLAQTRPLSRAMGAYGVVGPAAFGSYGPQVWGLGGVVGVGMRPRGGRIGIEARLSAARVPDPDPGAKYFDARFTSLGLTWSR